jgi:hypothetical protein
MQRFFAPNACEKAPHSALVPLRGAVNFGKVAADLRPLFGQGGPACCVRQTGVGDKYNF